MAETKLAHNHKDLEQLRKECKEKYNDLEVIEYKHEIIGKQIRKYDLKWFTPKAEIDLCGHATLGTAYVVANFVEPVS